MSETDCGTKACELRISKKRIADFRSRMEDQCIQLSRLALTVNQRRMINREIAEHILVAVRYLDIEVRELSAIENGQLR